MLKSSIARTLHREHRSLMVASTRSISTVTTGATDEHFSTTLENHGGILAEVSLPARLVEPLRTGPVYAYAGHD